MAGDDVQLKVIPNLVLGAVMSGDNISDVVRRGLLNSSAMNQRRFFNWAVTNYELGMPTGQLAIEQTVDRSIVREEMRVVLGLAAGEILQLNTSIIDYADEEYWAEGYVLNNRPADFDADWTPYFDAALGTIRIVFAPGDEQSFVAPADFLWGVAAANRRLLFASYQIITVNPADQKLVVGEPQLFTYRMGTGNAVFDALHNNETPFLAQFFPVLPIRASNRSVTEKPYYANVAAGYRRLTGGADIADLVDQIEEHASIGDMDHVFVAFGVALNTKEKVGKKYIYTFFQELMNNQQAQSYQDIQALSLEAELAELNFERWFAGNDGAFAHPLFGAAATQNLGGYAPITNSVRLAMPGFGPYDVTVKWELIEETQHLGNAGLIERSGGQALAVNDFLIAASQESNVLGSIGFGGRLFNFESRADVAVVEQVSKFRYRKLTIRNLQHVNKVYGSKSITINGHAALQDTDDSGFLVPLHFPTMRKMSMANQAQLAKTNTYLMINSYTVVKQKWYQTGFFKFLLVIGAIALAAFSGGASLGATAGLLGTNAAVGLALGATGVAAAVLGAAVNAVAAMVLSKIIASASTAIFGEKAGQIVAVIVSVVAMAYGASYAQTGTFNVDWTKLMQIDNLMSLTSAISGGVSNMLALDTQEVLQEIEENQKKYSTEIEKIEELSRDVLGMTSTGIDSMMLLNANEYFVESRDSFMGRTLMTGDDIIELSLTLIHDFADISLDLPLAPT